MAPYISYGSSPSLQVDEVASILIVADISAAGVTLPFDDVEHPYKPAKINTLHKSMANIVLEYFIGSRHLVRVIEKFVSILSPSIWDSRFTGGGAPSYHPVIMLKVILYAYSLKIFSCREIASVRICLNH